MLGLFFFFLMRKGIPSYYNNNYYRIIIILLPFVAVPKPEKPKVFGFGYPTPVLVNASIKTIPLNGIVQYDLLFTNSTDLCDLLYNKVNAIVLDGCHFTKNQTVSKLNSGRSLNCTICNSTANCVSLGIKRDQYFSLWLIAKAQNYSISSSCIGKVYNEDIGEIEICLIDDLGQVLKEGGINNILDVVGECSFAESLS